RADITNTSPFAGTAWKRWCPSLPRHRWLGIAVGFGLDSLIEVTSGAALLWRLHHDLDQSRREQVERVTLRVVGLFFLAMAVYSILRAGAGITSHFRVSVGPPGEQKWVILAERRGAHTGGDIFD